MRAYRFFGLNFLLRVVNLLLGLCCLAAGNGIGAGNGIDAGYCFGSGNCLAAGFGN